MTRWSVLLSEEGYRQTFQLLGTASFKSKIVKIVEGSSITISKLNDAALGELKRLTDSTDFRT